MAPRTKAQTESQEVLSKDSTILEATVAETKAAPKEVAVAQEPSVIFESTHQLGIFSDYIYNARNYEVDLLVENLGYGDAYVSEKGTAKVGDMTQRLSMGESKLFKGISKVYAASASQPVIQILELK